MKTKLIRIEQKELNLELIESIINDKIQSLESEGHVIKDVKINVSRDAEKSSGLEDKFGAIVLILYD